jgi:hypothetical protein
MAYGHLDVFWRMAGSKPLPGTPASRWGVRQVAVSAGYRAISRYHFSITNEAGQVKISDMDSANGTYVDGVLLKSNEARELRGGEELQIGHLRMIFYAVDETPTLAMEQLAEDTQRFERVDYGFTVEVTGPDIEVPPGSHTTIEIAITNLTEEIQTFTVTKSAAGRLGAGQRPDLRSIPASGAGVDEHQTAAPERQQARPVSGERRSRAAGRSGEEDRRSGSGDDPAFRRFRDGAGGDDHQPQQIVPSASAQSGQRGYRSGGREKTMRCCSPLPRPKSRSGPENASWFWAVWRRPNADGSARPGN